MNMHVGGRGMEHNNSRMAWGDIAKGIGIILVIMGHTFHPAGQVCKAIYLFHMPLFFFLAGYFFNFKKYESNFISLIKNTYNRIFIPILFSFLLFYNVLNKYDLITLLYGIGKPIPEWGINAIGFAMWFLYCLVVVRILLWCLIKFSEKFKYSVFIDLFITSVLVLVGAKIGQIVKLPWSIDVALVALFIAYAGYLCKEFNIFNNIKFCIFILSIAFLLGYIDFTFLGLSMNDRYYSNYPLVSIYIAVILSIALVYISKFLENIKIFNKFLAYLGANSIIIMIFHGIPHSSHGHVICTLWRLFISVIIIEIIASIKFSKNIYGAKSIKEIFLK